MLRQLSRSPPAPHAASMLVLAIVILAAPAHADVVSTAAPSATLEEVLAIARRLSPDLAARALDTEAAQARVEIAGSLADPMLRITSDEIDRTSGPRQNKMLYTVEQEFPLWGKRDLKRVQAGANVTRSRADARMTEDELVEKIKVAFAQYYQADQAICTTENLHRVVHDMARMARDRRMMRLSPIRCSTKRISHSRLTLPKKFWMSASSIQFTFLILIAVDSASNASCGPRPGRNP